MENPKAYIFDVFGTVVDWRNGVAKVCAETFAQKGLSFDPHEFADLWRGEYQPAMERIRSGSRGYVPLDLLHYENLERILENTGLASQFTASEKSELNRAWEQLPGWPDSSPGLYTLKQQAIIAPCSNGSIALMTRIAKFADLPWDCIVGAEIAQNYKPHPDAYLKSAHALGLSPGEVMMVAAHNEDLHAARENGLKTAFIPRKTEYGTGQTKDLEPNDDWDLVVGSLLQISRYRK
ncbi:MAG: haloacid dehalogenase type II [Rhizobiaceae bacterium]|nr:haloacid dehalogenase type II [Rhizobiaceae bacterium]